MKLLVEALVTGPIATVWRAYTNPEDIINWNFASEDWHCSSASVDLRVGGKFSSRMAAKDGSFGFDFEGEYTKIEPNRLIEYRFGDRTAEVRFIERPEGVVVSVAFDPEPDNPTKMQQSGWQSILDNFAAYVSSK
jgi:uncharacterized protein YndB with AHSA1/START domain